MLLGLLLGPRRKQGHFWETLPEAERRDGRGERREERQEEIPGFSLRLPFCLPPVLLLAEPRGWSQGEGS